MAGRPGATYAIEIHNRLDERVPAVTSVDGVNVVSGETAAWNQTGYVFRPRYVRIRYDSLDNLIAMEIIEKTHPAVPSANPFPASVQQQYVPDPPAGLRGDLH